VGFSVFRLRVPLLKFKFEGLKAVQCFQMGLVLVLEFMVPLLPNGVTAALTAAALFNPLI
jgi:hypothetical protein